MNIKSVVTGPSTLALSDSFGTIISFLSNKTTEECSDRYKSTRNTIILVISPTAKLYSIDLEKSKSLVRSLKAINPTFSVLYITTDETTESFEPLVKNEFANDKIIKTSGTVDAIVDRIASSLEDAPGQIIDLVCTNKSAIYEDYITPSITKQYEISYRTLLDIKEEIKIEVCTSYIIELYNLTFFSPFCFFFRYQIISHSCLRFLSFAKTRI